MEYDQHIVPASFRKKLFIASLLIVFFANCNEKDATYLVREFMLLKIILICVHEKEMKGSLNIHICLLWILKSKCIFLRTVFYVARRKISLKIHHHIFSAHYYCTLVFCPITDNITCVTCFSLRQWAHNFSIYLNFSW